MAKSSFTREERGQLLRFVREVIESDLVGAELPSPPPLPRLAEPGACFVTLKEGGDLRGCIGNIEAFEPLGENLIRNAINASQSDPRVPPLELEELPGTTIELSILTPATAIASPEEFRVGEDGIILRAAGRGAVFLPQVAPEQHWDRETTLRYLSRKAGLPENAWQWPQAELFTFQAEVFGEEED